jgi:hypothetical protein
MVPSPTFADGPTLKQSASDHPRRLLRLRRLQLHPILTVVRELDTGIFCLSSALSRVAGVRLRPTYRSVARFAV